MTYQVILTARSLRDLAVLPEKVATAILAFLAGPLTSNPDRVGKPLRAPYEGQHAARRGEYRVIYVSDADQPHVKVLHIEYRRSVYRTR